MNDRTGRLLAATIIAWSLVGIAAARAPWHGVRLGDVEATERGLDRVEGRIFAGALTCAVLIAGYRFIPGPIPPAMPLLLVGAGAIAAAAVARYAWVIGRAPARIREILHEVGLEGSTGAIAQGGFRVGAIAAGACAAAVLAAAVADWLRARRAASLAKPPRSR